MHRALLLALVACGSPPAKSPQPASAGEAGAVPGKGAAYSMTAPSAELAAAAVAIAGSCAFARPPGELADYERSVSPRAGAVVYASADFSAGRPNQIGVLRGEARARAAGPLAHASDNARGFAVLVVDNSGRVCRGYVTAASAHLINP